MASKFTRRSLPRWLALPAAITALLLLPSSAYAADAGDPDQGFPPCDQQSAGVHNTITMYDPSNGTEMGYAYLVYSSGCQTEWTTVHTFSPYYSLPSVWLQNQSGTNLYEAASSNNPVGTVDRPARQHALADRMRRGTDVQRSQADQRRLRQLELHRLLLTQATRMEQRLTALIPRPCKGYGCRMRHFHSPDPVRY
jgi:hypothetical protein